MAKRKRDDRPETAPTSKSQSESTKVAKLDNSTDVKTIPPVIQIITGSYERILHGITASLSLHPDDVKSKANPQSTTFSDSFLFNAHASSIRCLALSPLPPPGSSDNQGVFLATGGSDEKINVFSLSTSPVAHDRGFPVLPSLSTNAISENPRNRELGTLLHHSSNITALHFPTRSKLLSASEDNTIAVTRLKDLTVVSTVKAPRPKVLGQPSGDTAPPGATPAGVNDFAVHPSMKLMVSVGRGERCMRLWNLVTGKKAGVLNFGREMLQSVREGKYSSGEGRRIEWNPAGTEFAVAFERGVVIFGDDSKPKAKILPSPLTKVHKIAYVALRNSSNEELAVLAVSTEDGRVLFYTSDEVISSKNDKNPVEDTISDATLLGHLGGKDGGVTTRIKDFEILDFGSTSPGPANLVVVTASSDGAIRLFSVPGIDLVNKKKEGGSFQMGQLIGLYETGNRITCLKAFVMLPPSDEEEDTAEDFEGLSPTNQEDESGDDEDSD
ncbi:hypothetical protein PV10_02095 [Exophiala mesophila]|uniref:60S ribosome biogenesis protein Mak11 n=1 Tax=Exophiala mesophila TaxID=212818 RepID=A0A0D1ZK65_EXOME|nr:uncharacterized protein PV10_02095 [Exophiala mesophila]KIV94319.1 hypothetical protein PV10_02095 [Exophiala mesophila]